MCSNSPSFCDILPRPLFKCFLWFQFACCCVPFSLDARFLANPYFVESLRDRTGRDDDVAEYVLSSPEGEAFVEKLENLLRFTMPLHKKEGRSYLSVAVGCTGGHHRSVAIAEEVGRWLRERGFDPSITHRDIDR